MPQFEKHIEALIKDLYLTRTKIMDGSPYVRFKRGLIERLQEKNVFGPKAFAALYAKVVDKTINTSEYPSTLRTFIKGIGDEAFHRTYVELKQAEDEQSNKEIIKSNLQKLSKDELVDALADVYMACPSFSIANMLSNVQEIKSPIKEAINQQANMQRINAQFAEIKQPLYILEK